MRVGTNTHLFSTTALICHRNKGYLSNNIIMHYAKTERGEGGSRNFLMASQGPIILALQWSTRFKPTCNSSAHVMSLFTPAVFLPLQTHRFAIAGDPDCFTLYWANAHSQGVWPSHINNHHSLILFTLRTTEQIQTDSVLSNSTSQSSSLFTQFSMFPLTLQ